jgi:hypothetical protein
MKRASILETFDNENMDNDVIIELKNSISGDSSKGDKDIKVSNLQNIFLEVNEVNEVDDIDDDMSEITIESNIKNNSLDENILDEASRSASEGERLNSVTSVKELENILEENILEENSLVENSKKTLDPPVTLVNSPEKKKRVYKSRKK